MNTEEFDAGRLVVLVGQETELLGRLLGRARDLGMATDHGAGAMIHPELLPTYLAGLRIRARTRPVVASSFSPYFVDLLDAGQVWCVTLESTAVLADHPDWPEWEGKLRTGEFWGSVGEGWVRESPKRTPTEDLPRRLRANTKSPEEAAREVVRRERVEVAKLATGGLVPIDDQGRADATRSPTGRLPDLEAVGPVQSGTLRKTEVSRG
jgi:hypothetical protein